MNANAPYIPTQQSKFTAWLANFSTLITAAPATYGLLAADAVIIAGYYSAWLAAYNPVTSGATRTAQAVAAKNVAYATYLPLIRSYAQQIGNNVGVSSAAKIALGLNPKTSTPSPVSAPSSAPILVLQYAAPCVLALRYRDSAASPSSKAKPYGAINTRIVGKVSATPIVDPSTLPQLAVVTKTPFLLSTVGMGAGSQLYLAAYFVTRRGLASPPSSILVCTVV